MSCEVILIQEPALDLNTFLTIGHQTLGYSLSTAADSTRRPMPDVEKFCWYLSALRNEKSTGFTADILQHVSFSVLVATDDRNLLAILNYATGMKFITAETQVNGVSVCLLTGTLGEWKHACRAGATPETPVGVRTCYSKVVLLFDKAGLGAIWNDYSRRSAPDHSGLYLEDKRKS